MTRLGSPLLALGALLSAGLAHAQAISPPVDEKPAKEPPPATEPSPPPEAPPAAAPAPAPAPTAAPAPAPAPYTPWLTAPPTSTPAAPVEDKATDDDKPLPPLGPPGWQVWLGSRTSFFTSEGYDPFSDDDLFTMGSIGFSRRILSADKLSFAGALVFDSGSNQSTARGEATELTLYRLTAGPEARYHVFPTLYAFVRPTVGVERRVAALDEGSAGTTLHQRDWLLAVDGSAGAAWSFWDLRSMKVDLAFWVLAEGGYGFTQGNELNLEPDSGSGAPERTSSVGLGELSTSGGFFRVAVAGTF